MSLVQSYPPGGRQFQDQTSPGTPAVSRQVEHLTCTCRICMSGWGGAGLTLGDERGKADHCGISARKPQIPTCQPNMVVLLS